MPDQLAMTMADDGDGDRGGIGRDGVGGGRHRGGVRRGCLGLVDSV
jgi:hypothetical protein